MSTIVMSVKMVDTLKDGLLLGGGICHITAISYFTYRSPHFVSPGDAPAIISSVLHGWKAALIRYRRKQSGSGSKVISSSMSRHLSTHNISSKSIHAFLSNLAKRQTDKQMRAKLYTSSFVGGRQPLECGE